MKSQNRPSTAAWPVILAAPGIRSSRSCKVERTGEASMPGGDWRGPLENDLRKLIFSISIVSRGQNPLEL